MVDTEKQLRKFQKRYHYGKNTPCRVIKVPIQLMPQIEELLKPWERTDYVPLSEESFEQRKRVSIKDLVAREVARVMNSPESLPVVSEIVNDKPKPTTKEIALELHANGLNSTQIANELERRGILSSVGKKIDSGVIARWIWDSTKGKC